jgi:hypothetical protein
LREDVNKSRERDESIERLLWQSKQPFEVSQVPQDGPPAEACVDAETLAAWAEGGLSGPALELVQTHVADCGRCQALVGTFARIDTIVPTREPARVPRRLAAWLVPLGAAAAAVVAVGLWIAMPRNQDLRDSRLSQAAQKPNQTVAAPTPSSPQESPVPAVAAASPLEQDRANVPAGAPSTLNGTASAPAEARESGRSKEEASSVFAAGALGKNDKASTDQAGARAEEARRDAPRIESKAASTAAPAATPAPAALAVPSAPAPGAERERAVGQVREVDRLADAAVVAGVEIISPDPAVRWRIVGSVLSRSVNGGARWEIVPTGVTTNLSAGSASSPWVCWVVGRQGVVLLSTDGVRWRRVVFPEPADLSAVRATDARTATVSTVDGRTFVTTDGGTSWVLRQP